MTHTAEKNVHVVNGIDTSRITELATHMAQDNNFGKFRFRANNKWIDGTRSRTCIRSFYAGNNERTEREKTLNVDADQPAFLGGSNTAPNAVEHYLNALTSCINTTIVAHASVQGIAVETLSTHAEGLMDARGFFGVSQTVNRGFSKIKVDIRTKTTADEATLRNMLSYSPVYEMVSNAIAVEVHIILE